MKLPVDRQTLSQEGSGDPAFVSGYLGSSDVFDRALVRFAENYANQTRRDHAAFVVALAAEKST